MTVRFPVSLSLLAAQFGGLCAFAGCFLICPLSIIFRPADGLLPVSDLGVLTRPANAGRPPCALRLRQGCAGQGLLTKRLLILNQSGKRFAQVPFPPAATSWSSTA